MSCSIGGVTSSGIHETSGVASYKDKDQIDQFAGNSREENLWDGVEMQEDTSGSAARSWLG